MSGGLRKPETAVEDVMIRKVVTGTFAGMVSSDIIIKRQFNHIRIAFLAARRVNPTKFYFLIGYAEELLAHWLQCAVTLEIQTIADVAETIVKYK